MVPIRDVVIFPYMLVPFVIGRKSSVRALEAAMDGDKRIFLSTQYDASIDNPKPNEIYQVGTISNLVQALKLPDGNTKVLVEGIERARILSLSEEDGHLKANLRLSPFRNQTFSGYDNLIARVSQLFEQYVKLSQNVNYEQVLAAIRMDDISRLGDTICSLPHAVGRRETGAHRDFQSCRALQTSRGSPGHRDRKTAGGPVDPEQGQAPDGTRPERVLPQRKDQGDST